MHSANTSEGVLPYILLGITAVTGLIDAVSFLALGHVFTANMTGNIAFLAFAVAGTPGLSIARSLAALVAFMFGALLAGCALAKVTATVMTRRAAVLLSMEVMLLLSAGTDVRISQYSRERGRGLRFDRVDRDRHGIEECHCPQACGRRHDHHSADTDAYRYCGRFIARRRNESPVGQAIGLGHRNVCRRRPGCRIRTSVATAIFVSGSLSLVCVVALWASISSSQSKAVREEK
jgi:hypothetical protein